MAEAPPPGSRYSYADDRGWDDGPRWEVIDGQPFAMSPATASHDHIGKRRLYERFGVAERWAVHPTDRIVAVYMLRCAALRCARA